MDAAAAAMVFGTHQSRNGVIVVYGLVVLRAYSMAINKHKTLPYRIVYQLLLFLLLFFYCFDDNVSITFP